MKVNIYAFITVFYITSTSGTNNFYHLGVYFIKGLHLFITLLNLNT